MFECFLSKLSSHYMHAANKVAKFPLCWQIHQKDMSGVKLVTSAMVASIICFMADKLDANHASFNCRISEFYCKTGRCISADKVCNGADDCGDKSDELPYCTRK